MPLYYFDVSDNGVLMSDRFGIELDDLYEAREQAIALLPDMARNELPDGDRHEFSAVVRCREGRVRYEARLLFQGRWVEPPAYGREAPSVAVTVRPPAEAEAGPSDERATSPVPT